MRKPNNWDSAPARAKSGKETIPAGGHGCIIINAETITENWSGVPEDKLYIEIEIDEGTELDGFYERKLDYKRKYDDKAKWPGWYKTSIYSKDGNGDTDYRFKGLIRAIEKSNPDFTFEFDDSSEASLIGKRVGFVFRDEPFVASTTGQVVHYIKPAWPCSYDEAADQPIPEPKAVRGESIEKSPSPDLQHMVEDNEEPLPF